MLRPKKIHLLSISIVSIVLCLITRQQITHIGRSTHQAQVQNAPALLHETAISSSDPAEAQDSTRLQVQAAYGNLPLSFEPNRGQTDQRVKFVSRAGHRTVWLTKDEAVLAVGRPSHSRPNEAATGGQANQEMPSVLRMKFLGANPNAAVVGETKQPGTVNYFAGRPEQWRTKIPTYARVRYSHLYPGIDLVFYGSNRQLEYDLVVASGADPGRIKLAVTGAKRIRIDDEGNLVLETTGGNVIQEKPKTYQRRGRMLKPVSGEYEITGKNEVGFRLGDYDSQAEVVIDPVLRYSTFLGGNDIDRGEAIAVDSLNRAVVTGFACSPNFPLVGGIPPQSPRLCPAFVTKFDFTGSRLVFSTVIGFQAFGTGIALDSSDNIYLAGGTSDRNFPTTPGALQRSFAGGDSDTFITKMSADGSALIYSTLVGGNGIDQALGIGVDAAGNAYVAGGTTSTNFPTTPGAFQTECKLNNNGICSSDFVIKLNATGTHALYSTLLGGATNVLVALGNITVNSAGNAFVTGVATASDFPTTAGSGQPVFGGIEDAFVTELSSSGSHLIYSTFLGGTDVDLGLAIRLDAQGNAFVTGITLSTNFPVKQAFQAQCVSHPCSSSFVTKLNPSGQLLYSTYLGGGSGTRPPFRSANEGTGIAVTPNGQAYVTGITGMTNFPTTQTGFQRILVNQVDNFITKLDPAGKLIYSSYLGGGADESNPAVILDRDGNAYVTGTVTHSVLEANPVPQFPVTPGAFQQTFGGNRDAFVAKVVALCGLSTVNRSVTICSPGNGSTMKSPVRIIAGTTDVTPVKLTQIYLDGKKIFEQPLSAINVALPIASGRHRLTVQGLDTASVFFKTSIHITVSP